MNDSNAEDGGRTLGNADHRERHPESHSHSDELEHMDGSMYGILGALDRLERIAVAL